MKSKLKLVDEMCMKFEAEWTPDRELTSIYRLAKNSVTSEICASELATELVFIDIERRWQIWGKRKFKFSDADISTDELNKQVSVDNYFQEALACSIELTQAQRSEITRADWISRVKFGNAPNPPEAVSSDAIRRIDSFKPRIWIDRDNKRVYETSYSGNLMVGRQAKGEQKPYALERLTSGSKLICADGMEPYISRSQFQVININPSFATVMNCSTNRHFSVLPDINIAPGDGQVVKLPAIIDLDCLSVGLARRRVPNHSRTE